MPFRKSYGRKRMPTRAARKYKRKGAPTRSTPVFKKKVMAVVRRAAERKHKVFAINNGAGIMGSGLGGPGGAGPGYVEETLLVSLALAQGVQQEQRIGNTVTNAKLTIRGCITSLPYNATSNPNTSAFETHMVVYKNRKDASGNSAAGLKQLPGNVTGPVDGTLINTMYPYNTDLYKIIAVKKFNMACNPGLASTASNQGFGKILHRFSVDCKVASTIKYEDPSTVPANDWVGVAFYNINCDGTINNSAVIRSAVAIDGVFSYYDM